MKHLINFITILFLLSCGNADFKKDHGNLNKISEQNAKDEDLIKEKETDYFNVLNILRNENIISDEYSEKGIKKSMVFKLDDKYYLSFIQFEYDESLKKMYDSELVFNLLMVNDTSKILNYKIIDSVDSDDFNYLFEYEGNYFFEFYSSPVGYTIIYIFNNKEKKMFNTSPLNEGFVMDTTTFDYSKKKFNAKFEHDIIECKLIEIW